MKPVSETELQAAGEHIVFYIGRVPGKLCFFIPYPGIVQYQFDVLADVIEISDAERVIADIGSREIGTGCADLVSFHLVVGIVPVEFNEQLVLRTEQVLQEIKVSAREMPLMKTVGARQ